MKRQFTWRHDSILACLVCLVKENIPPSATLCADIPNHRASDFPASTFPRDISTSAQSDLEDSSITILELTVPVNSKEALQAARLRKLNKEPYLHLLSALEDRGYTVQYHTLEVGSLKVWSL